jgi:hypothetical protein
MRAAVLRRDFQWEQRAGAFPFFFCFAFGEVDSDRRFLMFHRTVVDPGVGDAQRYPFFKFDETKYL